MTIEKIDINLLFDKTKFPKCDINAFVVKFEGDIDVKEYVNSMAMKISDTSWLEHLDPFDKMSFEDNVAASVNKIVNEIFAGVVNGLNSDIGEYLVSMSAQDVLVQECNHTGLPLAELLKEKVSGNPGFDFHTISPIFRLVQGEAKYGGGDTRYVEAMSQIVDFINGKQKNGDLQIIKPFLTPETKTMLLKNERGFCAAFSLNAQNDSLIIKHALGHDSMNTLGQYSEFYLIAVKVC